MLAGRCRYQSHGGAGVGVCVCVCLCCWLLQAQLHLCQTCWHLCMIGWVHEVCISGRQKSGIFLQALQQRMCSTKWSGHGQEDIWKLSCEAGSLQQRAKQRSRRGNRCARALLRLWLRPRNFLSHVPLRKIFHIRRRDGCQAPLYQASQCLGRGGIVPKPPDARLHTFEFQQLVLQTIDSGIYL